MSHRKLLGSIIRLFWVSLLVVGCGGIRVTTLTEEALTATPIPISLTATPAPPTRTPVPSPTFTPEPRFMVLQDENNLPKTRLQTKRSAELTDNRIGLYIHGLWEEAWNPSDWLNREAFDLGVKRMRFAINELDVGMVDWSQSEFQITPKHDVFINSLADNGIINTYVLSFWDKANHPTGWQPVGSRFKTEEEIQRYLDFVRLIVHNTKGRVQYYEIWNEPDVGDPTQRIEVPEYINLVKRTVPVIHSEYPEARIVISVSDTSDPAIRDYLFGLLRSDEIMPLVDVVSWHPMYGTSPEFETEYYYGYENLVQQIRDTASGHGFRGEYWATEITWRSPECYWCATDNPSYSNIVAAKYYARGVVMHLGMDVTVGVGGMSIFLSFSFPTIRNLCTVMAGVEADSFPVEIQSNATNVKVYSFSLRNGDRLIAVWTDNAAVDEDPGVEATLIVPGFSAQDVTAIDVLYGLQQQIITSDNSGNLIINHIFIKDYPIFLRLTPSSK